MKKGNFEAEIKEITTVLTQIISQYLASNKRIVVPQLGAFIVKAPGEGIVFSELLKRDDGILRGLLQKAGMSELEAAGEIDRFTFEARHAVEHGEEFPIGELGALKPGPNGTIVFEYRPEHSAEQETTEGSVPETQAESHPDQAQPETTQSASQNDETPQTPVTPHSAQETPIAMPKVSPSVKLNPEPYVKGLRYGKPPKNTDAYTYANGKRRVDRFMIIAIAAAIVAVAAIAFGYIQMSRGEQAETEQLQTTEEPGTGTQDTAVPAEETAPQNDQQ